MSSLIRPYSAFEDFYRPFEGFFNNAVPAALTESTRWLPPVDITKNDSEFQIAMEVPGFKNDEVTVEARDGVLCIEGERTSNQQSEADGIVRRERHYGKFSRRFSLPDGATPDSIDAEVKDGMLFIKVPQAESPAPKKIAVK